MQTRALTLNYSLRLNFTNSTKAVNSNKLDCFCRFSKMLLFIKTTKLFDAYTLRQIWEIELEKTKLYFLNLYSRLWLISLIPTQKKVLQYWHLLVESEPVQRVVAVHGGELQASAARGVVIFVVRKRIRTLVVGAAEIKKILSLERLCFFILFLEQKLRTLFVREAD